MNELEARLAKICKELGVWGGAVMKPDLNKNVLVCVAHYNLPEDWVALVNPFDDTTLNGISYTENKTVIRNELHQETVRGAPTHHAVESIIVVPVSRHGQVKGTLELISDSTAVKFGAAEQSIVEQAASDLFDLL